VAVRKNQEMPGTVRIQIGANAKQIRAENLQGYNPGIPGDHGAENAIHVRFMAPDIFDLGRHKQISLDLHKIVSSQDEDGGGIPASIMAMRASAQVLSSRGCPDRENAKILARRGGANSGISPGFSGADPASPVKS